MQFLLFRNSEIQICMQDPHLFCLLDPDPTKWHTLAQRILLKSFLKELNVAFFLQNYTFNLYNCVFFINLIFIDNPHFGVCMDLTNIINEYTNKIIIIIYKKCAPSNHTCRLHRWAHWVGAKTICRLVVMGSFEICRLVVMGSFEICRLVVMGSFEKCRLVMGSFEIRRLGRGSFENDWRDDGHIDNM